MKYFIILLSILAIGCSKKTTYTCNIQTFGTANGFSTKIEKTCTENQMKRFIKNTSIDKDGSSDINTIGEVSVFCIKK